MIETLKLSLLGIFTNAPIWVWPLLLVLVFIGWRHSKDRTANIIPQLFLPLFGFVAVGSLIKLPNPALVWSIFAVFYVVGAMASYIYQQQLILSKQGLRLQLKGEWLTLGVLMLIYFSNFIQGTVNAVQPELTSNAVYISIFVGMIALAKGSFLGRAIKMLVWK